MAKVQRERRAQITHHAARWAQEPAETVAGLEATARGCEWLLDFWEYLAGLLRADGFWDQRHTARIVNLVGVHAPPVATLLWKCSLALTANLDDPADLEWAVDVLKIKDAEPDPARLRDAIAATLPGRDEARASTTAIYESERDRLEARRQRLWDGLDGPARDRALAMAAFDDGEGATLRRRYETASTSDLHRALNQIHTNHRERDRQPLESEPWDELRNEQSWRSEGPPYPMKVRACTLPPTRGLSEEPNEADDPATETFEIAIVASDPPCPAAPAGVEPSTPSGEASHPMTGGATDDRQSATPHDPGADATSRLPEQPRSSRTPAQDEANVSDSPARNEQSWPSEGPPYPMKVRACTLPPTRGLSEEPNAIPESSAKSEVPPNSPGGFPLPEASGAVESCGVSAILTVSEAVPAGETSASVGGAGAGLDGGFAAV